MVLKALFDLKISKLATSPILQYIGQNPDEPVVLLGITDSYAEYSFHVRRTNVHKFQEIRFHGGKAKILDLQQRIADYCSGDSWERFTEK